VGTKVSTTNRGREGRAEHVSDAGDDREWGVNGWRYKAVPEPGTERLTAEEVDEDMTDLLFGQPAEPLPRDR
jgi:hypothetical protein